MAGPYQRELSLLGTNGSGSDRLLHYSKHTPYPDRDHYQRVAHAEAFVERWQQLRQRPLLNAQSPLWRSLPQARLEWFSPTREFGHCMVPYS